MRGRLFERRNMFFFTGLMLQSQHANVQNVHVLSMVYETWKRKIIVYFSETMFLDYVDTQRRGLFKILLHETLFSLNVAMKKISSFTDWLKVSMKPRGYRPITTDWKLMLLTELMIFTIKH